MNTSQNTHSAGSGQALTAEQLEAFLEGKLPAAESQRVQKLLDDCELSKEALEGYSIVPGAFADVEALKKSIAKKSGMTFLRGGQALNWSTIGLGIVAIAALSFAITVFLNDEPQPDTSKVAATHDIPVDNSVAPAPANILSPVEDHFVNPEAKVVAIAKPQSTNPATDTAPDANIQNVMIIPIPVDAQPKMIADTSRPVDAIVAEVQYNAQVGFLLDLKITGFDKYYTTQTIEVKELPLTGVSADKENKDDVDGAPEEETVRNVPADQFLREGLIAFRDARYGKCISKMDVLLKLNENDINALFYSAVSYVKLEMYSKAIPLLDKIIADPNNVFDEEAEWYKALALEGNGDTVAANELFRKISAGNGFYAKQAALRLK